MNLFNIKNRKTGEVITGFANKRDAKTERDSRNQVMTSNGKTVDGQPNWHVTTGADHHANL